MRLIGWKTRQSLWSVRQFKTVLQHPVVLKDAFCTRTYSQANGHYPVWLQAYIKITKTDQTSIASEQQAAWMTSMNRLVSFGCHPYQLVEAPEVLGYSEHKVFERVDYLQKHLITKLSIPLLMIASASNAYHFNQKIKTFLNATQGFDSVSDFWKDFLDCTESDMDMLMLKNPGLLSRYGDIKSRITKANTLLKYGVNKSELKNNSRLLVTTSLQTLQQRLRKTKNLDITNPALLKMLSQGDGHFKQSLKRQTEKRISERDKWKVLSHLLNTSKEDLQKHNVFQVTHLNKLEARIRFILEVRGYSAKDILHCPEILQKVEVDRLDKAFHQLEAAGLEEINLHTVRHFLTHNKLPTAHGSQRVLQKTLNTDNHEMAELLPRDHAGLFQQQPYVLKQNYTFLNSVCGFDRTVILGIPVILGHANKVLIDHWEKLPVTYRKHYEKWEGNQKKLINLLQYDIERSVNFKHKILTAVHLPE